MPNNKSVRLTATFEQLKNGVYLACLSLTKSRNIPQHLVMFEKLPNVTESELKELYADFQEIMSPAFLLKNHILHEEGKVCHHLYIVKRGLARTFYYKDGKDITAHLALENGTITAIDSFIQRKRSRYNIELLEDSEIVSISRDDIEQLLKLKPQHEKIFRLFLEQIYVDLAERIEDLQFHNARERYDKLVENSPDLLQRVNLKHIASYLGITQETLSRIRGKV